MPRILGVDKSAHSVSGSSGSFTSGSASFVAVTGLSTALNSNGGDVLISLEGIPGQNSFIGLTGASNGNMSFRCRFMRDGVEVARAQTTVNIAGVGGGGSAHVLPPHSFSGIDFNPPAGSHTYTAEVVVDTGSGTVAVTQCRLRVKELL